MLCCAAADRGLTSEEEDAWDQLKPFKPWSGVSCCPGVLFTPVKGDPVRVCWLISMAALREGWAPAKPQSAGLHTEQPVSIGITVQGLIGWGRGPASGVLCSRKWEECVEVMEGAEGA